MDEELEELKEEFRAETEKLHAQFEGAKWISMEDAAKEFNLPRDRFEAAAKEFGISLVYLDPRGLYARHDAPEKHAYYLRDDFDRFKETLKAQKSDADS